MVIPLRYLLIILIKLPVLTCLPATFMRDIKEMYLICASENLNDFKNISLVKSDYKDFIKENDNSYDLIHVDIIHTYEATYECGLWAAEHSDCTLFHDTESFSSVKKAVRDIAKKSGKKFYNYPYYSGLGILY